MCLLPLQNGVMTEKSCGEERILSIPMESCAPLRCHLHCLEQICSGTGRAVCLPLLNNATACFTAQCPSPPAQENKCPAAPAAPGTLTGLELPVCVHTGLRVQVMLCRWTACSSHQFFALFETVKATLTCQEQEEWEDLTVWAKRIRQTASLPQRTKRKRYSTKQMT